MPSVSTIFPSGVRRLMVSLMSQSIAPDCDTTGVSSVFRTHIHRGTWPRMKSMNGNGTFEPLDLEPMSASPSSMSSGPPNVESQNPASAADVAAHTLPHEHQRALPVVEDRQLLPQNSSVFAISNRFCLPRFSPNGPGPTPVAPSQPLFTRVKPHNTTAYVFPYSIGRGLRVYLKTSRIPLNSELLP